MKRFTLIFAMFCSLCAICFAGPESLSSKDVSKEMAAPAPCPEWYSGHEVNVSIWGAFAFPGNSGDRLAELGRIHEANESPGNDSFGTPVVSNDLFLNTDSAFGGGADIKYFFCRYFGVGVEGYGLAANGTVGGVLGTVTLRYPIGCSRWAPYAFGGIGGAFGGSYSIGHEVTIRDDVQGLPDIESFTSSDVNQNDARLQGQGGVGIEYRFTKHIGIMADFSWNILEGRDNNFGLVRTGINFAF